VPQTTSLAYCFRLGDQLGNDQPHTHEQTKSGPLSGHGGRTASRHSHARCLHRPAVGATRQAGTIYVRRDGGLQSRQIRWGRWTR
jgi:hypothetical protein